MARACFEALSSPPTRSVETNADNAARVAAPKAPNGMIRIALRVAPTVALELIF